MRLISGPAGSGKTGWVLGRLRQALRDGNHAVRLLVPTATMARHLQNQLAREGFVFRPDLIQTLSGFVANYAGERPQVSEAALYLIVEQAAARVRRPEFARVERLPGFSAALARAVGELSSAGCDSARLASCLPEAPLAAAFLHVYREIDRELERRGLALRGQRLAAAAELIGREGPGGIRTVWLDGFHELPDPELRVIEALGRHADVTLTFEAMDDRLAALGFEEERLGRARPAPAVALFRAPAIEREAEEIARRILEQAASGRSFREIGVIVRAKDVYVPVLRSVFDRFGIPARFYFEPELDRHPAVRFLSGLVEALLSGWDHGRTLAALRLAPRFADSAAMDRFDFAVREQIPGAGLSALEAEADPGSRLLALLKQLGALEEWRSFSLVPKDWVVRLHTLRNLFRPAVPASPDPLASLRRGQAAALDAFDGALAEAAAALDQRHPVDIAAFWRAVQAVLRLAPLRIADLRRNVVHVLTAHEARQWVLPVVFVCGMVEKQFPQFHPQDPFFPDAARARLKSAGIRLRTAFEYEREERALFDSALSRASMLVTLSYPEFDARGERNLPSLFLDGLKLRAQESRLVRPRPRRTVGPPAPVRIESPALLGFLRNRTATVSPSALESYLQCPFQYFAGRAMRLRPAPPRPEKRFDFMTQGEIVHEVLARWWNARPDLEALFEEVFARKCEEKTIPWGYHTERLRNAMLDDLRAFARDESWPRGGFRSETEVPFAFELDGIGISGKIDRLDIAADGSAWVFDYKYSATQRVKERPRSANLLQAPLYLLAAERVFGHRPAGMQYIGLKGGVVYAPWEGCGDDGWEAAAQELTLRAVGEIRSGRIEPAPADTGNCHFCDARDACRVRAREAARVAEGA